MPGSRLGFKNAWKKVRFHGISAAKLGLRMVGTKLSFMIYLEKVRFQGISGARLGFKCCKKENWIMGMRAE